MTRGGRPGGRPSTRTEPASYGAASAVAAQRAPGPTDRLGSARVLAEGAARVPGRPIPRIWPGVPAAVSADPDRAAALSTWWVAFYLTRMGPLYRNTLRRAGFGPEADLVVAGGPARGGTARCPPARRCWSTS